MEQRGWTSRIFPGRILSLFSVMLILRDAILWAFQPFLIFKKKCFLGSEVTESSQDHKRNGKNKGKGKRRRKNRPKRTDGAVASFFLFPSSFSFSFFLFLFLFPFPFHPFPFFFSPFSFSFFLSTLFFRKQKAKEGEMGKRGRYGKRKGNAPSAPAKVSSFVSSLFLTFFSFPLFPPSLLFPLLHPPSFPSFPSRFSETKMGWTSGNKWALCALLSSSFNSSQVAVDDI